MEVVRGKTTQAEIAVQVPVAMKEVAAMTKHQSPQKIKVIIMNLMMILLTLCLPSAYRYQTKIRVVRCCKRLGFGTSRTREDG